MHAPASDRAHIAIRVADFDEAIRVLRKNGVELEEPTIRPGGKSAFLKETDPAGHRVHIVWTRG
ncbi:MAG: VOC family protein [Armatimonadota bacterium]